MKKKHLFGILIFGICFFSLLAFGQEGGGEEVATSVPRVVLYQAINFFGLVAILYFLLRGRVRGYFVQRHDEVAAALKEANRVKTEAENKHQEYVIKIQELQREADSLMAQIRKDGQDAKLRMIEEAKRLSESIRAEAKRAAENEIERARAELYDEVLEKALDGARALLSKSVAENDQRRLQKEFVEKIEAVQ